MNLQQMCLRVNWKKNMTNQNNNVNISKINRNNKENADNDKNDANNENVKNNNSDINNETALSSDNKDAEILIKNEPFLKEQRSQCTC